MLRSKCFKVDNSGQGNCGYYAYSISLMYYLRHQKSLNRSDKTNHIFKTLRLGENAKSELLSIINQEKLVPFTREQKKYIESILGPATRSLMASYTKESFLRSPKDSSLFTAAAYGLSRFIMMRVADQIKSIIGDNKREDDKLTAGQQENNTGDLELLFEKIRTTYLQRGLNQNLVRAEIYKVSGMVDHMKHYADAVSKKLFADYKQKLTSQKDHKKEMLNDPVMSDLLNQLVIDFFINENYVNLNAYISHIAAQGRWATDENIILLHEAVQGLTMKRDDENKVVVNYECPIGLMICENGESKSGNKEADELVINNSHNVHWTSYIPAAMIELIPNPQSTSYNDNFFRAKFLTSVSQNKFYSIQHYAYQLRNALENSKLRRDEKEEIYLCAFHFINNPGDEAWQLRYQLKMQELIDHGGNYRKAGYAMLALGVITLSIGIMASTWSLGALTPLSGLLFKVGCEMAFAGTGSLIIGFFNQNYSVGKKMADLEAASTLTV